MRVFFGEKIMKMVAFAALLALATTSAGAQVIDFDSITTGATVDSYYDGGTDSFSETGPSWGVSFTPGDWHTATNFGETSQPNLAYSDSGTGGFDSTGGFSHISFTYGGFEDTVITLYSGLGGTGSVLAQVLAGANNPNAFSSFSINFSGTAHSFVIASGQGAFGIDDINLNGAVPEPASWALMLGGFGLAGAAMRRRRTAVRFA